jgi:hypothetical protein
MKRKIQNAFMAALAIAMFTGTLVLSMKKNGNEKMGLTVTAAQAQTSGGEGDNTPKVCFVRTLSNCPKILGQDLGQRVTCDLTGTIVPNSTCTPVQCTAGSQLPFVCGKTS